MPIDPYYGLYSGAKPAPNTSTATGAVYSPPPAIPGVNYTPAPNLSTPSGPAYSSPKGEIYLYGGASSSEKPTQQVEPPKLIDEAKTVAEYAGPINKQFELIDDYYPGYRQAAQAAAFSSFAEQFRAKEKELAQSGQANVTYVKDGVPKIGFAHSGYRYPVKYPEDIQREQQISSFVAKEKEAADTGIPGYTYAISGKKYGLGDYIGFDQAPEFLLNAPTQTNSRANPMPTPTPVTEADYQLYKQQTFGLEMQTFGAGASSFIAVLKQGQMPTEKIGTDIALGALGAGAFVVDVAAETPRRPLLAGRALLESFNPSVLYGGLKEPVKFASGAVVFGGISKSVFRGSKAFGGALLEEAIPGARKLTLYERYGPVVFREPVSPGKVSAITILDKGYYIQKAEGAINKKYRFEVDTDAKASVMPARGTTEGIIFGKGTGYFVQFKGKEVGQLEGARTVRLISQETGQAISTKSEPFRSEFLFEENQVQPKSNMLNAEFGSGKLQVGNEAFVEYSKTGYTISPKKGILIPEKFEKNTQFGGVSQMRGIGVELSGLKPSSTPFLYTKTQFAVGPGYGTAKTANIQPMPIGRFATAKMVVQRFKEKIGFSKQPEVFEFVKVAKDEFYENTGFKREGVFRLFPKDQTTSFVKFTPIVTARLGNIIQASIFVGPRVTTGAVASALIPQIGSTYATKIKTTPTLIQDIDYQYQTQKVAYPAPLIKQQEQLTVSRFGTKQSELYGTKFGTKYGVDFQLKPTTKFGQKIEAKFDAKLKTRTETRFGTQFKQPFEQKIDTKFEQPFGTKFTPQFENKVGTKFSTKFSTKFGTKYAVGNEQTIIDIPINLYGDNVGFSPTSEKFKQKRFLKGFDVFLRRRGKYKKVAGGLTKGGALSEGMRRAETGLGATFKIRPSSSFSRSGGTSYLGSAFKFRTKIERGEKIYIEKRKYRLDQPGEKHEIKAARGIGRFLI